MNLTALRTAITPYNRIKNKVRVTQRVMPAVGRLHMKSPEQFARELKDRIIMLAQNPPPFNLYDSTPQPEMMPAVYWPFDWLIETIRAAQQAREPDAPQGPADESEKSKS